MWDAASVRALMFPRRAAPRDIPPRRNDSPQFYPRRLSRPTFRKVEFSRSARADSRDGITGRAPGSSILGCGFSYGGMLPEDTARLKSANRYRRRSNQCSSDKPMSSKYYLNILFFFFLLLFSQRYALGKSEFISPQLLSYCVTVIPFPGSRIVT